MSSSEEKQAEVHEDSWMQEGDKSSEQNAVACEAVAHEERTAGVIVSRLRKELDERAHSLQECEEKLAERESADDLRVAAMERLVAEQIIGFQQMAGERLNRLLEERQILLVRNARHRSETEESRQRLQAQTEHISELEKQLADKTSRMKALGDALETAREQAGNSLPAAESTVAVPSISVELFTSLQAEVKAWREREQAAVAEEQRLKEYEARVQREDFAIAQKLVDLQNQLREENKQELLRQVATLEAEKQACWSLRRELTAKLARYKKLCQRKWFRQQIKRLQAQVRAQGKVQPPLAIVSVLPKEKRVPAVAASTNDMPAWLTWGLIALMVGAVAFGGLLATGII